MTERKSECPTCWSDKREVRKRLYHPTEDVNCFDSWHDGESGPARPRTKEEFLDSWPEHEKGWTHRAMAEYAKVAGESTAKYDRDKVRELEQEIAATGDNRFTGLSKDGPETSGPAEPPNLLTTGNDRETAARVGEWLAEDFHAGNWENGFVSNLAKDAIALEAYAAALRSEVTRLQAKLEHCEMLIREMKSAAVKDQKWYETELQKRSER